MTKRLWTPKEVAERYSMTVQWVYHNAFLKAHALRVGGKSLRYREEDLEEFENKRAHNRGFDIVTRRITREEKLKAEKANRPKSKVIFLLAPDEKEDKTG
jgi:hypothetical protein